jgi:hypothetical protein
MVGRKGRVGSSLISSYIVPRVQCLLKIYVCIVLTLSNPLEEVEKLGLILLSEEVEKLGLILLSEAVEKLGLILLSEEKQIRGKHISNYLSP